MTKKIPARNRGKTDDIIAAATKKEEKARLTPRDSAREMIESVVIAFVLAFLFRTFEAEAFVIPTGSMAPTLMGQHKDLKCDNCEYSYRVSASDEEGRNGRPPQMVTASICPICRYQMDFGPGGHDERVPHATYKGDRILVAKFPYEFSDPERWDVAVFKNPGEAKQ
ncbi:MAG TPA: S26 family signal peptidase, partial [Pirellulales bacterium]|nr:S26 family signal peptidase [Pirellulales bacterium]